MTRTVEQRLSDLEQGVTRILHGEAIITDTPELTATVNMLWEVVGALLAAVFAIFVLVVVLSFKVGIR